MQNADAAMQILHSPKSNALNHNRLRNAPIFAVFAAWPASPFASRKKSGAFPCLILTLRHDWMHKIG